MAPGGGDVGRVIGGEAVLGGELEGGVEKLGVDRDDAVAAARSRWSGTSSRASSAAQLTPTALATS